MLLILIFALENLFKKKDTNTVKFGALNRKIWCFKLRKPLHRKGHTVIDHSERHNF
jgi:hypothetical protein